MEFISNILPISQAVISVLLIISILLQQSGTGLGAGFGGGSSSEVVSTRRGFEKTLLKITIILSALLFISAVLALFV